MDLEKKGRTVVVDITRMLEGELQVQLDPDVKQWLAQSGTHAAP